MATSDFARRLEQLSAEKRSYVLGDLLFHLVLDRAELRVFGLLTSLPWLEAKAGAGLAFDLAEDFRQGVMAVRSRGSKQKVLRLLLEAVRRDVHFITKRPSTLFQCLWNTCWWYDCSERGDYYGAKSRGNPCRSTKTRRRDLSTLLERWRQEKEQRSPGFTWLRSLRPPAIPLGGTLCVNCAGHSEAVYDVALAPDGSCLVTASYDGSVRLWDGSSGRELGALNVREGSPLVVGFTPDGIPVFLAARRDGAVVMTDARTGLELSQLEGPDSPIEFLQLSGDGCCALIGCGEGQFRVCQVAGSQVVWERDLGQSCGRGAGRSLARELTVLDAVVQRLKMTGFGASAEASPHQDLPRASRLLSALSEATGRLRQTQERKKPRRRMSLAVTAAAVSMDGQRVALATDDAVVRAFETRSGVELVALECEDCPSRLVWSPNGQRLAGGGLGGVWCVDLPGGRTVFASCDDGLSEVTCLAFLPDGLSVVCGERSGDVTVWDVESGRPTARMRGHTRPVECVAVSADGRLLASGSEDTTARVWELTGEQPAEGPRGHKRQISCLEISYDERLCATGSHDGSVFVWGTVDGRPLAYLEGHSSGVAQLLFSRDSKRLYTCSDDRTIRIWDVKRGKEVRRLEGHTRGVQTIDLSRNEKTLVSASDDATVRVWDAASGRPVTCLEGHEAPVQHVAVSAGGRLVASGAFDSTLRFWDVGSGQEVARLRSSSGESLGAPMVHFLAATGRVAIVWPDGTVRLWDLLEAREVACRKPNGHIHRFAVAEDACRVVVETQDREIWLWDGEELELIDRCRGFCLTWGDIRAISQGMSRERLRACPTEEGSAIGLGRGEQAVAWCPSKFLSAVPTKRVWMGPDGPHLVAYHLEGTIYATAGRSDCEFGYDVAPADLEVRGEVDKVILERTRTWAAIADRLRACEKKGPFWPQAD